MRSSWSGPLHTHGGPVAEGNSAKQVRGQDASVEGLYRLVRGDIERAFGPRAAL
jgi:hypothetical protein